MTTLVLLPGMDGTGELFDAFVAALGASFDIKVVSYPANEPLGYRALTTVAREALPANSPFFILGESFSGPIAIALAADRPPGLQGLILCCTFARNPHPPLAFLRNTVRWLPVKLAPVRLLSHLVLGRFSSGHLRDTLVRAIAKTSSSAFHTRLTAVLSVDVSGQLARVGVPVLYLRARQDKLVPRAASALVSQLCSRAETVAIDGPHFLLQACPVEAAGAVSAFIHSAKKAP